MKKQILLPITFLLMFFSAATQAQQVGALTVFSEDGDKFFLILNGQRQNEVAKTNIRVDGLNQMNYNVKIIFENTDLPEITKSYLMIGDQSALMDVTYKIKHDKNGMPKMGSMPFSYVAYKQTTSAPDVYVVHADAPAATTVSQTTTTTTVAPTSSTNVNVAGLNMNVTVTDPTMSTSTTTTHTTTTTSSTPPQPSVVGCRGAYPMNGSDFSSAFSTVKNQGFDETKLSTAKQIAGANCLSANQVTDICKLFGFEESKLDFAKFAYDHCTEPGNYFKVNNVFGFSSSVDNLTKYIQGRH